MLFVSLEPLNEQQQETESGHRQATRHGWVVKTVCENRREIIYSLSHRLSTEDNPSDGRQRECEHHLAHRFHARENPESRQAVLVLRVDT